MIQFINRERKKYFCKLSTLTKKSNYSKTRSWPAVEKRKQRGYAYLQIGEYVVKNIWIAVICNGRWTGRRYSDCMALGLLKSFFEGLFTYPIYRNYKGAFTQGVFCKVKRDRLGYFAVKNNSFRNLLSLDEKYFF